MSSERWVHLEQHIPDSCLLSVFVYGPLEVWKRDISGHWELVGKEAWGKGRSARTVFKRLLVAPGRRLSRGAIQDDLWPDADDFVLVDKTIYNAINRIRRVTGKELVRTHGGSYEIADQLLIWTDYDVCEELLKEAENCGSTSAQSRPLLEQALGYLEQGELVEGESGTWVYGPRQKSEGLLRQCRFWLAQIYEGQGKLWQAGELYRAMLQNPPLDEDALCRLIAMFHRQGQTYKALKCFQEYKTSIENQGYTLSAALEHIVDTLQGHAVMPFLSPAPSSSTWMDGVFSPVHKISAPVTTIDLAPCERNVRTVLHIHRTSNAQSMLKDIDTDMQNLEYAEEQAQGEFQIQIRTLLLANGLLATKIVKDLRQYMLAYAYANNAVRIAKHLGNEALIATTKYTRGCTKLEWGLFGIMKQGRFCPDIQKIHDALRDFQSILLTISREPGMLHPQLQGFTQLQMSRAQHALFSASPEACEQPALFLADQAAEMAGRDPISDPYMRLMMTGTLSGLHLGGYYLVKAGILNTADLPNQSVIELHRLKRLTEQTYGQDETRNLAWSNITLAEALLGLKEYEEAAVKAKSAMITCYHIHSMQNAMMITDIYTRITTRSQNTSTEVKELGDMIHTWYGHELHDAISG
jgi:DNA-binding SARP family transcriptional activator